MHKLRLDILCTGLDHIRRGYESFARECFDALKDDERLDTRLFKGSGDTANRERALNCLARDSFFSTTIAKLTGRSGYHIEQATFLLSYLLGPLRNDPPDVIFTSDANLANYLSRKRKKLGGDFRILYSNGGPISPPFPEYDHIQQVAAPYLEEAFVVGEPPSKHSLVPYGIHISEHLLAAKFENFIAARRKLGLPENRKIVISVGYVSATHKRMDHIVREVANISRPLRPFLLLLGQQDASTEEIRLLCAELLGDEGWRIDSCPYEQVSQFYAAADVFVLASLKEGFGRVFLEASAHGLPCIADYNPVMRYVLGDAGHFVDMRSSGELSQCIELLLSLVDLNSVENKRLRVDQVARRFSWDSLRESYIKMINITKFGP